MVAPATDSFYLRVNRTGLCFPELFFFPGIPAQFHDVEKIAPLTRLTHLYPPFIQKMAGKNCPEFQIRATYVEIRCSKTSLDPLLKREGGLPLNCRIIQPPLSFS